MGGQNHAQMCVHQPNSPRPASLETPRDRDASTSSYRRRLPCRSR